MTTESLYTLIGRGKAMTEKELKINKIREILNSDWAVELPDFYIDKLMAFLRCLKVEVCLDSQEKA